MSSHFYTLNVAKVSGFAGRKLYVQSPKLQDLMAYADDKGLSGASPLKNKELALTIPKDDTRYSKLALGDSYRFVLILKSYDFNGKSGWWCQLYGIGLPIYDTDESDSSGDESDDLDELEKPKLIRTKSKRVTVDAGSDDL